MPPREVCELALAHVNNDRAEAAYRRSDLFEGRWTLMQEWADYLMPRTENYTWTRLWSAQWMSEQHCG